jgi:Fur family transcriptional regulator, iron response regulator
MIKIDNYIKKLRKSGLRPTKQRLKICEVLFSNEKTFHFTVGNLKKIIQEKLSEKISLATVYNTVHAFKRKGYLKAIYISSDKSYFDTNTSNHHHFFDMKNNELVDIDASKIELKNIPDAPKGKSIKDIDVIINIENDSQ